MSKYYDFSRRQALVGEMLTSRSVDKYVDRLMLVMWRLVLTYSRVFQWVWGRYYSLL